MTESERESNPAPFAQPRKECGTQNDAREDPPSKTEDGAPGSQHCQEEVSLDNAFSLIEGTRPATKKRAVQGIRFVRLPVSRLTVHIGSGN